VSVGKLCATPTFQPLMPLHILSNLNKFCTATSVNKLYLHIHFLKNLKSTKGSLHCVMIMSSELMQICSN